MPSVVNDSDNKLLSKGFWVLVSFVQYAENYRKIVSGFGTGFSCQLGPLDFITFTIMNTMTTQFFFNKNLHIANKNG